MLITDENILHRFSEHLSWATEIDLATAWATSNGGLRALQRRVPSLEVRAVVGLWGNLTEPFALKILANMGQLRAADASRRFHPKVFVFRGAGRSVAWVGSANFTSGGFGMNEEALSETSDTASVQNWFDDLWERCDPLDEAAIDDYAESRQTNPPPPPPRPPDTFDLTPMQLLERVQDWRSYVTSIPLEQWAGRELYEQGYCARGEMENRIKEQQLNLFADRTSSHQMQANQLRLYFASFAYVLMHALRRLGLVGTGACTRAVRDDSREGAQDWSAHSGQRSQGVVVDVGELSSDGVVPYGPRTT